MKTLGLIAALAVMLVATPAAAQSTSPPAPTARQLQLSHRLFLSLHMDQTMSGLMQPLVAQMVDIQARQIPGFKPEWRQPLVEATQEAMGDLLPNLMKRTEMAYAQVLSEDELQQSIAFYESPAGQSIIRKLPQVMPMVLKDFQAEVLTASADITVRFCKKIGGCDKATVASDKPSAS